MIKAVIKEIIIFLLLLVSIALILGILFYDYMPINKTVPSKVEPYNIPADIQNELNTATEQNQNIISTYSIDSSALRTYSKGKIDPFAVYNVNVTTDNNTANSNNGSNAGSNTSTNAGTNTNSNATTNNNNNTNSEGTFYEIPPSAPTNTGK